MKKIFPAAWNQFAEFLPEEQRTDILKHYYEALTQSNRDKCFEAAIHWALYESACSSLIPNFQTITTTDQKMHALALARLEAHYFTHEVVAPENSLLKKIDIIRHIPTTIVQGRYDIICPIETANALHCAWPEAKFVVVPDAGHSVLDPSLLSCLIKATDSFKSIS